MNKMTSQSDTGARITDLSSGLRVVTETMSSVETASVGVWVDVGARDESADINGVSHLIEHMAFKGTERRSAQAIAEEVEAVGGHLNAYTSREQTAFYAKVMKEDVGLAVDVLADILQNSVFDADELARERAVVLQEIAQCHDTPDDLVFDQFQTVAFPDQPLGRSILGPAAQVEAYDRNVLMDYMKTHYAPSRMVLAGAGQIDHDALVDMAANAFDGLSGSATDGRAEAAYSGGDAREERELEQVHFVVGFKGVHFDDPDFYPLQMFSTVLGGGMSSRLFQEVRERRGLAYSIFSFASAYVDSGIFGIYAGAGRDQMDELVPVMAAETMACRSGISQEETDRARAQLKSGLLMSLESTSSRCERLARHMLIFGRPIPIDEMVRELDAVTPDDLHRVAERVLGSGPPTVAALGPIDRIEGFDALAERYAG